MSYTQNCSKTWASQKRYDVHKNTKSIILKLW